MHQRVLSGFVFAALLAGQPMFAADTPVASLEPLYFLSGEWRGTDGEGKSYRILYQLTSGGTTLTETLTPANSPAMTTMYYADGEHIMLTHYCSMNNQPRMRADAYQPGVKVLVFSFLDATNLKSPSDAHMHQVAFDFKDQDHFNQIWVLSKAGKELPKTFTFERTKQ
jgi:hypothetical protein